MCKVQEEGFADDATNAIVTQPNTNVRNLKRCFGHVNVPLITLKRHCDEHSIFRLSGRILATWLASKPKIVYPSMDALHSAPCTLRSCILHSHEIRYS